MAAIAVAVPDGYRAALIADRCVRLEVAELVIERAHQLSALIRHAAFYCLLIHDPYQLADPSADLCQIAPFVNRGGNFLFRP